MVQGHRTNSAIVFEKFEVLTAVRAKMFFLLGYDALQTRRWGGIYALKSTRRRNPGGLCLIPRP